MRAAPCRAVPASRFALDLSSTMASSKSTQCLTLAGRCHVSRLCRYLWLPMFAIGGLLFLTVFLSVFGVWAKQNGCGCFLGLS